MIGRRPVSGLGLQGLVGWSVSATATDCLLFYAKPRFTKPHHMATVPNQDVTGNPIRRMVVVVWVVVWVVVGVLKVVGGVRCTHGVFPFPPSIPLTPYPCLLSHPFASQFPHPLTHTPFPSIAPPPYLPALFPKSPSSRPSSPDSAWHRPVPRYWRSRPLITITHYT